MPTKFKEDGFVYEGRGRARTQKLVKYHIKGTPKQELIDYLNNPSGKPKIKQKCRNELTRRGIKIVWTSKESNELDMSRLR